MSSGALSLLAAVPVGAAAGYLGSLMITRRMALVGDALGHVALPGMGLALVLGVDPSAGAFVFLLLGITALWKLERATELSAETLVGVLFVSSLAVGFLIVPRPEILESLIGDLGRLTPRSAVFAAAASAAAALLVQRVYPGMMLAGISEDLAAVDGVPVARAGFLYLLAIALVVAAGVRVTGSLLVGASVILPAATARLLSADLRGYAWTSAGLGAAGSAAGVLAGAAARFPPGPAIVLIEAAAFLAALASQLFAERQSRQAPNASQ